MSGSEAKVVKISVVIPALNEGAQIGHCLASLTRQRFTDFEVIVVDNGSSDDTVEVAQWFGCRVLFEVERGATAARQHGFDAASGEIIASTDADTVVPPNWLELIEASFREDPNQVGVYGPILLRDQEGIDYATLYEHLFAWFLRINHTLGRPHFCGPNFAVKRDAFREVLGFRANGAFYTKAEDLQLSLKIKQLGTIRFMKELVAYTSGRKLIPPDNFTYIWSNCKDYFSIAWLGRSK